jgi:hypothetical protein
MDKTVTVVRPDLKSILIIYPALKSYASMPLPAAADGDATKGEPKLERTELGREEVDGRQCIKYKVVYTGPGGAQEFTTWNAVDLQDFPVQVQTKQGGGVMTSRFSDIKVGKPDAAMFDAPADYTKYGSIQEMMGAAMRKMMGGE